MIGAEFYKGFIFHLFQYEHYASTDWYKAGGCRQHYIARMISGSAKICTAEGTLHLTAGDVFYIPKGLQYRSHWYPASDAPVRFYSFGFDHFYTEEGTRYRLQILHCSPGEREYLSELERDLTVSLLSVGRLYRFLGAMIPKMDTENPKSSHLSISKAMDFMRQHTDFSIKDVAQHCGISESGLYAIFSRELRQTPVQVRHRLLAEKATQLLLTTDLSIEEISNQLNFSSSSYFRKILRSQTGKTPSQIRRSSRQI